MAERLDRQTRAIEKLCELLQVLTHQNALLIETLSPPDDDDTGDEHDLARPQYLSQRSGRG